MAKDTNKDKNPQTLHMKETSPGKFVLSHFYSPEQGGTVFTNVPNTDATKEQSEKLEESLKNGKKDKNPSLNLELNETGNFSYKKKLKASDIASIIQQKVNEMTGKADSKDAAANSGVPYKEDIESKKKFIQKLLEIGKEKRRILIGEYRNPISPDPRNYIKTSVMERLGLTEEQTDLMMKNGAFKKELEEMTPKKLEEILSKNNMKENLIKYAGMSAEEADKLIEEGIKNRTVSKQLTTEHIARN
jgi:hypothetical protein